MKLSTDTHLLSPAAATRARMTINAATSHTVRAGRGAGLDSNAVTLFGVEMTPNTVLE